MGLADRAIKGRYTGRDRNRFLLPRLDAWLALPWTWLFLRLRLGPNTVSVLSLLVSVAGMSLVAFDPGPAWTPALGGALLIVGLLWDHSDGQVARARGLASPAGALLDSMIDRFVETGWLLALAVGPFVGDDDRLVWGWPSWAVMAVGVAAVHAMLYYRWSALQRDVYNVQKELRASRLADGEARVPLGGARHKPPPRTLYLPFAFNRDTSLWLLFVATLSPDWPAGLAVLAALHLVLALEQNWHTMRELHGRRTTVLQSLLDPEYHR